MKKFGIWFIIQLTLIFMKLCEVITWSWAGVLIPLWVPLLHWPQRLPLPLQEVLPSPHL